MNKITTLLKGKNWREILAYSESLSEDERYSTIAFLKELDIDKAIIKIAGTELKGQERAEFYQNRHQLLVCQYYFLVTCTRSYDDVKKLEINLEYYSFNPLHNVLANSNYEPLISFYKQFPPDYLDRVVKDISKERFRNFNFKTLWKLFENKWVQFDEAFFVNSLFNLQGFDNDHFEDATFLMAHPLTIDRVFLKFYKHEIPVLDLIKSKSIDYSNGLSTKSNVYWTEVFKILIQNKAIHDRIIISHLLESLLNNWKQPHLNWHIRLLDLFKPTDTELLENQSTLYSILGTGQHRLINYSMQCIHTIYGQNNFDETTFLDSIPLFFSNEKCGKAIRIALNILEFLLSKCTKVSIDYREQLCPLFLQSDPDIQEKASKIIIQYFNDENLSSLIQPYFLYLKQSAKEILNVHQDTDLEDIALTSIPKRFYQPIIPISDWNELLMHIGTCIRTQSAKDIDLFFEGVNQLQFEFPEDYQYQLKPYSKQLSGPFWENDVLNILSLFIDFWRTKSGANLLDTDYNPTPFLAKKADLLLVKLEDKNNLPFLSTPTHEPFYVHPHALLDRIFAYEESRQNVDLEDLIVACNRTLLSELEPEYLEKSKRLKGPYSSALLYFFGVSEQINFTKETLPLWTQITRIKSPNGIFPEFLKSSVSNYLSVVKPFEIAFRVDKEVHQKFSWFKLHLENNWNFTWFTLGKSLRYEAIFYHTASTDLAKRHDISYQMSLNPHYLDAQLCRYLPALSTGNEVHDCEKCLYPMQFILENQVRIYHSGWLYIAVCLLFEKKISRDLAAEYIELVLARNENTSHLVMMISQLINDKFAPVNRFIEYLDKPNSLKRIKLFQYQVLSSCILNFDKQNLPVNSKKIIQYHSEWKTVLRLEEQKDLEIKLLEIEP